MKRKLSISIEEKVLKQVEDFLDDGTFRNKSHLIEFALNKFIPTLSDGDIDLHDPAMLRKLLFHGNYEGRDLSVSEIKSLSAAKFRKVRFSDPTTGFAIKGQSLMIYYSALFYVKEHPEVGLNEAANKLNKGKSNQAGMDEILAKAKF